MIDEQNVALHTKRESDSDIHYSWKIKLTSHKYCVLFLTNKLKFERKQNGYCQGLRGGNNEGYCLISIEFRFYKMRQIGKMYGGDVHTRLGIYQSR